MADINRDTVYLIRLLSNLPKEIQSYFIEIFRCAVIQKKLSKETKEMVKCTCYHGALPIDEEEVLKW